MAYCWEEAGGLPNEIAHLFSASAEFAHQQPELLLAIPEYKVPLPGGASESQNDVFALLRCDDRTIAMTVTVFERQGSSTVAVVGFSTTQAVTARFGP